MASSISRETPTKTEPAPKQRDRTAKPSAWFSRSPGIFLSFRGNQVIFLALSDQPRADDYHFPEEHWPPQLADGLDNWQFVFATPLGRILVCLFVSNPPWSCVSRRPTTTCAPFRFASACDASSISVCPKGKRVRMCCIYSYFPTALVWSARRVLSVQVLEWVVKRVQGVVKSSRILFNLKCDFPVCGEPILFATDV